MSQDRPRYGVRDRLGIALVGGHVTRKQQKKIPRDDMCEEEKKYNTARTAECNGELQ